MNLVLRGGVALLATFIVSLYLGIQPASGDKDLRIHDIQGADQTSSFIGEQASVSDVPGVVTVVLDNGFYMQDPLPDDDAATSEGIFVFTNATPITTEREPLGIGDAMRVSGRVIEFTSGGANTNNLSTTQIDASGDAGSVMREAMDVPLPIPAALGIDGRTPPDITIDDDRLTAFDPDTDGIDFFESLEGMVVEIPDPLVVEPTNRFGEFIVVGDQGLAASRLSSNGGLVVSENDLNPERIWVKNTIGDTPRVNIGDVFVQPIVGVLGYSFGNYKVFTTQPLSSVVAANSTPEVTALTSSPTQLTVAAFNVENLDPSDRSRLSALGQVITNNLKAPDILALSEVQDNDGATESSITAADQTYEALIGAILRAGGPEYAYADVAPEVGQDGGQPGGNIRLGFLYQPQRVRFASAPRGSATQAVALDTTEGIHLTLNPGRVAPNDPAFSGSRKPVAAEFRFNEQTIFVIANHFKSKRGDSELFGKTQPPELATEAIRLPQAEAVHRFVDDLLAADPDANVLVLGDLNDFQFSETLRAIAGDTLQNLIDYLPGEDRYTIRYQGNLQAFDHILVSQNPLFNADAEYDIVHINAGFPDGVSDHDPVLVRLTYPLSDSGNGSGEPAEPSPPGDGDGEPIEPNPSGIFPELSGSELMERLAVAYAPRRSLGYDKGRDYLYSVIDNRDGILTGAYTGYEVRVSPTSSKPRQDAYGQGINAEHVWPQSKGAKGAAKSDLHNLLPTRVRVNSTRGNNPFGEIPDSQTDRWFLKDIVLRVIPSQNIDGYSESRGEQFEPREIKKGNIARAMFYFYTMYKAQADAADANFFPSQRSVLCHWHNQDLADAEEAARSHAIAASPQGNENPFILDAALAKRTYCMNP